MKYLYTVTLSNRDYDDDDFITYFISDKQYTMESFDCLVQELAEKYVTEDEWSWDRVIDNVLEDLKKMGFTPIEPMGSFYKYCDDSVDGEE
jgi:hypothetical protein